MLRFSDLKSFLMAGFTLSQSLVVKRDFLQLLSQLEYRQPQLVPVHSNPL